MGRKHRRYREAESESEITDDEDPEYTYTLMPDTKSPFSCCCICYRYLLDVLLVLALSPFIINCFIEAIIYLIKFEWSNIGWGNGILVFFVVSLWLLISIFGILCCIAVVKKGVFTRRLRQRRKREADEAERLGKSQSDLSGQDSMA